MRRGLWTITSCATEPLAVALGVRSRDAVTGLVDDARRLEAISKAVTELSILRLNALLAQEMKPSATCDTTPVVITGSSAMMGLRKMISSSTMIAPMVAMLMITAARLPDDSESRVYAAVPVIPPFRSVPESSA
jgi:hypothetical protein